MPDKLTKKRDEPQDAEGPGDYFIIECRNDDYYVSSVMAKHIEAAMDAEERWVTFVNIFGSRVRIKTALITGVRECTAEQRSAQRRVERAEYRASRSEQPWDENE